MFKSGELKPLPSQIVQLPGGEEVELRPKGTGYGSDAKVVADKPQQLDNMAGSWEDVTKSSIDSQ